MTNTTAICTTDFKGTRTQWFKSADVNPIHKGVYEVSIHLGGRGGWKIYFSRWTGKVWMTPVMTLGYAATTIFPNRDTVKKWRGLVDRPMVMREHPVTNSE